MFSENINIGDCIFDKYIIKKFRSKNEISSSYLASLKENPQKNVFLKIFDFENDDGLNVLEIFQNEVGNLFNVNHPNVPVYLDYFDYLKEDKKYFVLVQEYIPGKSLEDLIEEGHNFSYEEVEYIFRTVLDILIYTHNFQPALIHREIHPKNLILSGDHIFLVDFGVLSYVKKETSERVKPNQEQIYHAPEQSYGKHYVSSDLYSLGMTALALLAKKLPSRFTLKRKQGRELIYHFKNIPKRLKFALYLSLNPDPYKRPQSAAELLRILNGHISQWERKSLRKRFRWHFWIAAVLLGSLFLLLMYHINLSFRKKKLVESSKVQKEETFGATAPSNKTIDSNKKKKK